MPNALLAVAAALLVASEGAADDVSWEAKLQKDLATRALQFRSRAPRGTNATVVKFKLLMRSFYFDVGEEQININTWMIRDWTDPRLTWDPAAYGDLDKTQVSSPDIWTPNLQLRNGVRIYKIGTESDCTVRSSGAVHCKSKALYDVMCSWTRFSDWPYDTRTCRFEFGNDDTIKNNVVFAFDGRGVSMLVAEYGPIWNIIDYEQGEQAVQGQRGQRLNFTLTLERQGEAISALAAWPVLALSVLTLVVAGMPARSRARAPLAAFSLAAHFIVLQIINQIIPQRGRDLPSILRYMSGSIVITTATLIISFGIGKFPKSDRTPPHWVSSLNTLVSRTPARLVLQLRSPSTVADAVLRNHEAEWLDFVSISSCLIFIIEIIVYLSLYCIYVPRPLPITQ